MQLFVQREGKHHHVGGDPRRVACLHSCVPGARGPQGCCRGGRTLPLPGLDPSPSACWLGAWEMDLSRPQTPYLPTKTDESTDFSELASVT